MATEEQNAEPTVEKVLQKSDEDPDGESAEDEDETKFVEWDPSGRFGRTTTLLGRGTYKNVYMAFDEEEGMDVAWNQVKVAGLPREEKQRLLSEVEILKELDHKNIIKLYHSWITTDKDEVSVNFITEACAQTLKKYSKKLKTNLDLRAVKSWSRQILRGLDYLHSHDPPIVHRDLKCENIFVNQNQGEVKIGDLGLAAALDNQRTKSVIGTPEFMAPELYDEDYDERVDIYSFGMCMIELVTHECPYSECSNPAQIYKRVSQGVKPEALDKIIDADLRSFIMKCISPIEKRLTAKELMNDPFLDKGSGKPREVKQHTVVEEEPEVARPGGTKQMAVLPEKKGGSLDFRVKGRILEDKTLRLRLRIGDASGHTRTVEFPFNTDKDSSYSVASEMIEELQLPQSDIRTVMNEIENEVKFL
ncbi:uncharacterized protein MICPUCDRAFT_26102, partial [Micromonas pusilla CCMP1545]